MPARAGQQPLPGVRALEVLGARRSAVLARTGPADKRFRVLWFLSLSPFTVAPETGQVLDPVS